MSNFAFNNPAFKEQDPRAVATYPGGAQAGTPNGQYAPPPPAGQIAAAQQAAVNANLEGMYAAPSAGAIETDRMTVEDTVWKTAGLFGILLVFAAIGWFFTLGGVAVPRTLPPGAMWPWLVGALGGFVLAMVVTFSSRKKVRPALIFAYAAFEGLFIGGISAFFEVMWPGIVLQATLATAAVVAVTLALFASGKVRASAKMTKIVMIAMLGYLLFSVLNIVLMMFNVLPEGQAFGMLSAKVAGIPLGLIIGVLVVFLAAYSLVMDFDQIQQGVRNGAPRVYGWLGGFGIMVTVVWLYVEILRMIAIARSN